MAEIRIVQADDGSPVTVIGPPELSLVYDMARHEPDPNSLARCMEMMVALSMREAAAGRQGCIACHRLVAVPLFHAFAWSRRPGEHWSTAGRSVFCTDCGERLSMDELRRIAVRAVAEHAAMLAAMRRSMLLDDVEGHA